MAFALAWLHPEQTVTEHKSTSGHLLHPQKVACEFCGKPYSLECAASFLGGGTEIANNNLLAVQDCVKGSHPQHQEPYLSIAITF